MIRTEGSFQNFRRKQKAPEPFRRSTDLNLDIKQGEVFGFLGPNGAGKTTTVRMLCALIGSTSGRAWVNNYEVGRQSQQVRASVGILTEQPGMYDRLSAEKNLTIYAKLYGVKDVPGQVEKYLRMLGLWERRKDPAGSFSKGMKQKLAIARAILHEPATLFLDEPTAGLDPEAAKLVRDFVEELKTEGRTIFLCTHNLDEADRLCSQNRRLQAAPDQGRYAQPDEDGRLWPPGRVPVEAGGAAAGRLLPGALTSSNRPRSRTSACSSGWIIPKRAIRSSSKRWSKRASMCSLSAKCATRWKMCISR